jgi:hydrogenase maturation protein HypF
MAEHGVPADQLVVGVAFDGTGFGNDGTIWGGEILVAGYGEFERFSHLRTVPLPGGDAAIRRPARVALAHLWAAGIAWDPDLPPVADCEADELAVLARQLERNLLCVPTSSMGRLFDAVSSLLGVRHRASYEAQAAIELEWLAQAGDHGGPGYRFALGPGDIDAAPVLRALIDDLRRGERVPDMAARFHQAVARLIADVTTAACAAHQIDTVALSGGVFQNALLLRLARQELARRGAHVLTHRVVPPNDGGLALGQVAIGAFRARGA